MGDEEGAKSAGWCVDSLRLKEENVGTDVKGRVEALKVFHQIEEVREFL